MAREHAYRITTTWTGNLGQGTAGYRAYAREHTIGAHGKPDIRGSSDPAFRGDPSRWNPEDLFVAALSACHMLWYLHLCAEAGMVVEAYVDDAVGEMVEEEDGSGRFTRVELRPRVSLAAGTNSTLWLALHEQAHAKCFIANSVHCEVHVRPTLVSYQPC